MTSKAKTYFGHRIVSGAQGPKTGTTPGIKPEAIAPVGKKISGRELDGRTWEEFPDERN